VVASKGGPLFAAIAVCSMGAADRVDQGL